MKHEILLEETCTPHIFLSLLYEQYPYDIEEKMVFTLLEKDTFPHPALVKFISYYAGFPKYCIVHDEPSQALTALCAKMSQLYQDNKSTLHTHVFQFDAALKVQPYKIKSPYAHLCLTKIPFLSEIQLHTLPILPMDAPYHEATIIRSNQFLYKDISIDAHDYLAISVQISDKHGIVYIPKTQIGIGIALTSIYEVVVPSTDMDFILLYGLSSHEDCFAYYFDETNQIYTGLIAGERYHHFIYVMQMMTTLYNALCIEKKDLPVPACMLSLTLHDGNYGVVLMGNEHSGKSEGCDCLREFCNTHQIPCRCIFENCGTLHFLDNNISATGIQIGACVAVEGLMKQRIFQKLPACAFLKHKQKITHILFPFTSYKETCRFHFVHAFYYLSKEKGKQGYRKIEQLEEAKQLFIQGQPKQNNNRCEQPNKQVKELIDQYFNVMMINDLSLGELSIQSLRKEKQLVKLLQMWNHDKMKDK